MTVSTASEGKPQIRPRAGNDGFRAMCFKNIARYFGINFLCGLAMTLQGGIFLPAPSSSFAAACGVKVAPEWRPVAKFRKCQVLWMGLQAPWLPRDRSGAGKWYRCTGDCDKFLNYALLSKSIEIRSRWETSSLEMLRQ